MDVEKSFLTHLNDKDLEWWFLSSSDRQIPAGTTLMQEGKAVEGFFHPDRVVYGVESERAKEILAKIYKPLNCPLLVTDLTTAEIIKHAANAFLSTKISFINMVSDMCESVGADITKVSHGIGLDPRIGADFLQAGIGFGGYWRRKSKPMDSQARPSIRN